MTRDEKIELLYHKGCEDTTCLECKIETICSRYTGINAEWTSAELDEGLLLLGINPDGEAPATEAPDVVNHPQHYELPGGLECIDAMVATQGPEAVMAFCKCNAFKYLWRHMRKKGNEDVEKARWYLNKWHELREEVPKA